MKTLQTYSFLIDPTQAAESLKTLGDAFRLSEAQKARRKSTYYDTFDWRLHGRGLRLVTERRVLGGSSASELSLHLEGLGEALHSVLPVDAAEPGFVWDLPEGRIRERLESVLEMRRVLPLMTITVRSRGWNLLGDEDKTVARLRLEASGTRTVGSSSETALAARLFVEPVRGYSAARRLSEYLHKTLGLQIADRPVFDEAAAAVGLEPGDYSSKVKIELHSEDTALNAVRRIFLQLLDTMEINEAGTRKDVDSEFLHDFRVAVRRTRAGLSQIKKVLPEDVEAYFKNEFSWLGKITGPTRDLDVYLLKMPDYQKSLHPDVARDLEVLATFLSKKQKSEQKKLARGLGSTRYRKLVADWRSFLSETEGDPVAVESSAPGPANAARPIRDVGSERIWKIYRRILKQGLAIDESSPAERLHDVRLECKKLRYLMEFFRSLFDKAEIEASIKELKRLQDNLGDFNDYEVQQASLAAFAEEMSAAGKAPTATLLAMGQLQFHLAEGQERERLGFGRRFERFASAENQERFRRLFKSR